MGDTDIEWTHRPGTRGRTWNPTQGCSRISEGCRNCYAERMAARFAENGWSKGLINIRTGKWSGDVRVAAHKLADPLKWRDPSTVFVNSMSDLFHEGFTNEQIAASFGVMAACPQHTFQILTKRADRLPKWYEWAEQHGACSTNALAAAGGAPEPWKTAHACGQAARAAGVDVDYTGINWPLPNVWIGVSCEDQDAFDERWPHLAATPAAVRFLSCEPLIGGINVLAATQSGLLGWAIGGCESGPGARHCDKRWLRWLRDQLADHRVPFFLKQAIDEGDEKFGVDCEGRTQGITCGAGSKRKAGRVIGAPYLDGVQHLEFP